MRTNQDRARVVMAAKLVTDHVKDLADTDRKELFDALAAADSTGMKVKTDDGIELGTISHVPDRPTAKVVDEKTFTAWVKANRPDQIREVVDKPYRDKVLKDATKEGIAVDAETGEVIPGIELRETRGYISVRENEAGRNLAKAMLLRTGLLQLGQAPAESDTPVVVDAADISQWPGLDEGSTW